MIFNRLFSYLRFSFLINTVLCHFEDGNNSTLTITDVAMLGLCVCFIDE